MVIEVPPLRERTEDIPLLTEHFIAKYREAFGRDFSGVTSEVMDVFLRHPWPGNVRELKHSIEHACILCPGGPLKLCHLPVELRQGGERGPARFRHPRGDSPREELLDALERCHWNKTRASRALGVSRSTLYRKMAELGIAE
jgi:DNA-binding NtrC family response regulator